MTAKQKKVPRDLIFRIFKDQSLSAVRVRRVRSCEQSPNTITTVKLSHSTQHRDFSHAVVSIYPRTGSRRDKRRLYTCMRTCGELATQSL